MAVAKSAQRERVYSVTELTRNVKGILESAFQSVWVEGELSGRKIAASGHFYGTLKDEKAQISVVMWKGNVKKLGFDLEDGTHYLCFGSVSVYESRGQYQLLLEKVEPAGLGALQLKFEQLKKRLLDEGLFDERHKQPIPAFPRRIGVVTSERGAAIRDILSVLTRRFAGLEILVHHAAVQGAGAAQEIARAIDVLDRLGHCDVLIVGRGGGSLEDLWAFNEEPVARAIFNARTPIISAVGHEVDYTIADFVADRRAPTPSAAAELVVAEREAVITRIADHRRRLSFAMDNRLARLQEQVAALRTRYGFQRPRDLMAQAAQRVDDMHQMLVRHVALACERAGRRVQSAGDHLRLLSPQARVAERAKRLQAALGQLRAFHPERRLVPARKDATAATDRLRRAIRAVAERDEGRFRRDVEKLNALNPLRVLERGYSVTTVAATGAVLTDARRVRGGDAVRVRLRRGELDCRVEAVRENGNG